MTNPTNELVEALRDDTEIGRVQWHCSEEGAGPDVGISIGLGNGCLLWIGELLSRDEAGNVGFTFYGRNDSRKVAGLADWEDIRNLFEECVAPALSTIQQDNGWRPIRTAAKIEDAPIMGWDGHDLAIVNWVGDGWSVVHDTEDYGWSYYTPTHWQLLPTPPKDKP